MFTDSHCHLFKEYYNNLDEIINDANKCNVTRYISAATNISSINEMLSISNKYPNLYLALGIHPESVDDNVLDFEHILEENINNKKIIAVGEIGLDYYYGKENKNKQIELFEYQLKLAEKYNLPVVIHSREATFDTIKSLKKYKVKGIIHCFSGSLETAKEYINMGFLIGVGGVMTFKNSKLDEIIKEIPLSSLVLETDAPYLTPEPFRKYQNEPKYIKTIAEYLSNIKHISVNEVSKITEENINKLFFA